MLKLGILQSVKVNFVHWKRDYNKNAGKKRGSESVGDKTVCTIAA